MDHTNGSLPMPGEHSYGVFHASVEPIVEGALAEETAELAGAPLVTADASSFFTRIATNPTMGSGPMSHAVPGSSLEAPNVDSIEFRVAKGGAPVRRLRLTGNRYTFGNAEGCSIRLSDPTLRPMHAVLVRDGDRIVVRAYSVPIQVNGDRVTEVTLSTGDKLRLGDYEFELISSFETDAPSSAFSAIGTSYSTSLAGNAPLRSNFHQVNDQATETMDASSQTVTEDNGAHGKSRGSNSTGRFLDNDEVIWRQRLRREIDQWRERQAECDQREQRCDDREVHLRGRESELWARAENLYRREAQLQSQESAVHQLHDEYAQRQSELIRLRDEAREQQENLAKREAEFANQEWEYQRKLEEATARLVQSQTQAESATDAVQQMREQFDSLNEQIESLSAQQSDLQFTEQAEREQHQHLRRELEVQRDRAIDAQAESEAKRREAESRIEEMAEQLESLKDVHSQSANVNLAELEANQQTINDLRDEVAKLQTSVEKAREESNRFREDYQEALESVQQLEALVAQSNERGDQDRETWNTEADSLRAEIERLSEDLQRTGDDLDELRQSNDQLTSKLEEVSQQRDEARSDADSRPTSEEFQSLREQLDVAQEKLEQLQSDLQVETKPGSIQPPTTPTFGFASVAPTSEEPLTPEPVSGSESPSSSWPPAAPTPPAEPDDQAWPTYESESTEASTNWDDPVASQSVEEKISTELPSNKHSVPAGEPAAADSLSDAAPLEDQAPHLDEPSPSVATNDQEGQILGNDLASSNWNHGDLNGNDLTGNEPTPAPKNNSDSVFKPEIESLGHDDLGGTVSIEDEGSLTVWDSAESAAPYDESPIEYSSPFESEQTTPDTSWDATEQSDAPLGFVADSDVNSRDDEQAFTSPWADAWSDQPQDDVSAPNQAKESQDQATQPESIQETESTQERSIDPVSSDNLASGDSVFLRPSEESISSSAQETNVPASPEPRPWDNEPASSWNSDTSTSQAKDETGDDEELQSHAEKPETEQGQEPDSEPAVGSLASMLIADLESEPQGSVDSHQANLADPLVQDKQANNFSGEQEHEEEEELSSKTYQWSPDSFENADESGEVASPFQTENEQSLMNAEASTDEASDEDVEGTSFLAEMGEIFGSDSSSFAEPTEQAAVDDQPNETEIASPSPSDAALQTAAPLEASADIASDEQESSTASNDDTPGSDTDDDDDDSIEAYMNRLLRRVQGTPGEETGTSTESVSLSTSTSTSSLSTDSEVVLTESELTEVKTVTEPIDPDAPIVPRSRAPERNSNLSAMRELANQSARSAINRSSQSRSRSRQKAGYLNFAVAGFAVLLAIGSNFMVTGALLFLIMAMAGVVAAISVRDGMRNLADAYDGGQGDKTPDASRAPEEAHDGMAPAAGVFNTDADGPIVGTPDH